MAVAFDYTAWFEGYVFPHRTFTMSFSVDPNQMRWFDVVIPYPYAYPQEVYISRTSISMDSFGTTWVNVSLHNPTGYACSFVLYGAETQ
jgi:hypothetical protein